MTTDGYLEGILQGKSDLGVLSDFILREPRPSKPEKRRTFAYYACHDDNVPGATGDVFYFVGKLECADGKDAREKANVVMPIGFYGYVVITEGMGCADDTVAVRGVFVDNRTADSRFGGPYVREG